MKPHRLSGEVQATTLRLWVRLDSRGTSELLQLWKKQQKGPMVATNSLKEKEPWQEIGRAWGWGWKKGQSLTSLTSVIVSLTSRGYFDFQLTVWPQTRCCLLLLLAYLEIECTLLFSHHMPKILLLPSSLSLPLPQLLPFQHLISIYFQFPLRLFIKV